MNTLGALSLKLGVFEDLQKDVHENTQFVKESENQRETLQVTITKTATELETDTRTKKEF